LKWILLVVFAASLANAEDTKTVRSYPLPKKGALELSMPAEWRCHLRQPPDDLPPTITLAPAAGNSFQVMITPLWAIRPGVVVPDREEMRKLVQGTADQAKPHAMEETIPLREIAGASGTGYCFTATDKAPKPDEFKYMTQGIIRVGEIALLFTILTNDGAEAALGGSLEMLKSATHVAGKLP
jgi:hypothetical protein